MSCTLGWRIALEDAVTSTAGCIDPDQPRTNWIYSPPGQSAFVAAPWSESQPGVSALNVDSVDGETALHLTRTAGGAPTGIGITTEGLAGPGMTPRGEGVLVTVQGQVQMSVGGPVTLTIEPLDGVGAVITATPSAGSFTHPVPTGDSWTSWFVTFTVPAGVTFTDLRLTVDPTASGDVVLFRRIMGEDDVLASFFTGDTTDTATCDYNWTGPVSNSPSTRTATPYAIAEIVAGLTQPPDGLGMPELRIEDVTYPQRDGVRHFDDWYSPRIITLDHATVCGCCTQQRVDLRTLMQAWSRKCDDVELVIFTPCHGEDPDRSLVGPFGVIGRPRVATMSWMRSKTTKCAQVLLRFDAVDHRLYVLDADGTPGSGTECVTLTSDTRQFAMCFDETGHMCFDETGHVCFDTDTGTGGGPVTTTVGGTLCVHPTITLIGPLTTPQIENLTTGQTLRYQGTVAGGSTVVIDTENGTATEGGVSRTHLLTGDVRMSLDAGEVELRLVAAAGDGTAQVCWRPAVLFA